MSKFNTLDDLQPAGKVVFVRADLNVPVKDGKITDTTRIDRLVPTLKELVKKGAKVVVGSHFGRPKGQRNPVLRGAERKIDFQQRGLCRDRVLGNIQDIVRQLAHHTFSARRYLAMIPGT